MKLFKNISPFCDVKEFLASDGFMYRFEYTSHNTYKVWKNRCGGSDFYFEGTLFTKYKMPRRLYNTWHDHYTQKEFAEGHSWYA